MKRKTNSPLITGILLIIIALVSTACSALTASPASGKDDLQVIAVEDVRVEIGVGSPIPVEVAVSGAWPGLCTQIGEISQQVSEGQFEISLLASADTPGCPPDQVGLPFGMHIPLNMVEMPYGEYTVVVNGVSTSFEWNPTQ